MMNKIRDEETARNEVRKGIIRTVEHLAVLRREATLLGVEKKVVDEMIYTEAKVQFDKFDDMDEERLMLFMLGDMLTNAPKEMIRDMFDELGGELNG